MLFEGNDFMFELTKEDVLRSQIVTLNKSRDEILNIRLLHLPN